MKHSLLFPPPEGRVHQPAVYKLKRRQPAPAEGNRQPSRRAYARRQCCLLAVYSIAYIVAGSVSRLYIHLPIIPTVVASKLALIAGTSYAEQQLEADMLPTTKVTFQCLFYCLEP